jgi:tetratricopeptide (TPR) repeat protein
MEERIIDDEYGRGIRLKKTEDGFVDVTDELAARKAGEEEQTADEVSFEFPVLEEDDEDLATLTPEEAIALRKKKAEEAAKRKADYEKACQEGNNLLDNGEFLKAEQAFEKALQLDEVAHDASVGYWRAKTENFANPDALISEYANEGLESLEYDLGVDAADEIRTEYKEVFRARLAKLQEEEKPLAKIVEDKQKSRRELLSVRLRNSIILFAVVLLPTLTCMILTAVFGFKIPTTREDTYILPTIILGAVSFVLFLVLLFFTNKLLNAVRIYGKNERLQSSEEGKRLVIIRAYAKLYQKLLAPIPTRAKPVAEDEKQSQE